MNLTSMMDCVWLLLITFIITFPMIEQSIPVNLPKDKAKPKLENSKNATVSVTTNGLFYVGNTLYQEEALKEFLEALHAETPDILILVRGDEGAAYGHVLSVLKIIRDVGITRMSLVTREN